MKGLILVNDDYELNVAKQIINDKKLNMDALIMKMKDLNEEELKGYGVLIGYSAKVDRDDLTRLARNNIKLYITRSTGFNHIDIEAAKALNIKIANIPGYSPNAIAELTLALALDLNRLVSDQAYRFYQRDFKRPTKLFKEIRDCTVGILGVGSIGAVSARYFNAMGAKVIGYNRSIKHELKDIVKYLPMQEVIDLSDILLLHLPYHKNENHYLINKDSLKNAKSNLIIVNTARGELVNLADIIDLIKQDKLMGYGADVFENEQHYIGKKVPTYDDPIINEALNMFPRIIFTAHMGAATNRAVETMIKMAIENFQTFAETSTVINEIY
ncbi:MAG: NAD(P)-dependent oxidoreductase [Erysipelotrichaceae bacterium]|nr:NAD(P)-dependent oxidoreductase [Erysipelotrichaceae bacterium]